MTRKEIWRRLGSALWLPSQALDLLLRAWDSFSQGEFAQLYRVVCPYTMCGNIRLRGLYAAVRYVVAQNIPGDVVECGAARGGSAALMGLTLKQLGASRPLWVFDTFDGIPAPTAADPDWEIARLYTGTLRGDLLEVQALFQRLGILGHCKLIKGPFRDTLSSCAAESIAVLHLDCDWYESVKLCLEHLYDRVSPGGVIQIDDYGHWEGTRKAVDEFLRRRSVDAPLRRLDYTGRQMIKP